MEVKKSEKSKNKGLKIFLIILLVLVIVVVSVMASSYLYYKQNANKIKNQNESALKETSEIIEYGNVIPYKEIISRLLDTNKLAKGTAYTVKIDGKVLNPKENYKAEKVGNISILIETNCNIMFFKNITNKKENIWKIEDTQKPILEGVSNKEITLGDTFDVKDGIKARDVVDGDLEVEIEGDLDTTKVGEYLLTVKAIDKNKNETKQEFTVTVKEKEDTSQSVNTNNNVSNNNNNNNNKPNNNNNNNNKPNNNNNNNNKPNNNNNNNNNNQPVDPKSTKEGRLKLAKEEAQRVVAKIITPGMTKKDKALAICNYIYETVETQTNQSTEAYKTNYGDEAYAALILKKAACSGRCNAVMLLCDATGLECQHINANKWTHQWNKVKIDDGSWLVIDSQINLYGLTHPLDR